MNDMYGYPTEVHERYAQDWRDEAIAELNQVRERAQARAEVVTRIETALWALDVPVNSPINAYPTIIDTDLGIYIQCRRSTAQFLMRFLGGEWRKVTNEYVGELQLKQHVYGSYHVTLSLSDAKCERVKVGQEWQEQVVEKRTERVLVDRYETRCPEVMTPELEDAVPELEGETSG